MRTFVKNSDLTRAERLEIARLREGRSQYEAAIQFGVSLYEYRKWENHEAEEDAPEAPRVGVGTLETYEQLRTLRRRNGVKAGTLAKKLNVSRYWLYQMERGMVPTTALEAYWSKNG